MLKAIAIHAEMILASGSEAAVLISQGPGSSGDERREVRAVGDRVTRAQKGADLCLFAPSLVLEKFVQLLWNEWRGRRDSNSRPLP
jgi:hypothetical protein